MTSIEQSRSEQIDQTAARVWHGGVGFFGSFFAALGAGLRGLGEARTVATTASREYAVREMSETFARALCENPNSAMEWLYYAAQLRHPGERHYCITRAVQIDPTSPILHAELRRLQ